MKFNNIIYSIILHLVLIFAVVISFSNKILEKESNELLVKVEITNSDQLAILESKKESKIDNNQTKELIKKEKNEEVIKSEPEKDLKKEEIVKKIEPKKEVKKIETKKPEPKVVKPKPKEQLEPKKPEIEDKQKDIVDKKEDLKDIKQDEQNIAKKDELLEEKPIKKKDEIADNANEDEEDRQQEKSEEDLAKEREQKRQQEIAEKLAILQRKNQEKEFMLAQKSIAGLGLTNREKYNLYSQIKSCFRRAVNETKKESEEKILVKITITRSGHISSDIDDLEAMIPYRENNKEDFVIAIKNAKRALAICDPLRGLPQEKYDVWREVILEFSHVKSKEIVD